MMIRKGNLMGNRTAIRTRVDAIFSYRTENRIPIRFAANRTGIRMGNHDVKDDLKCQQNLDRMRTWHRHGCVMRGD
jgi:hypothetical protein